MVYTQCTIYSYIIVVNMTFVLYVITLHDRCNKRKGVRFIAIVVK